MTQYLELSDWESTGSAAAWAYMGFAAKLGTSVRDIYFTSPTGFC